MHNPSLKNDQSWRISIADAARVDVRKTSLNAAVAVVPSGSDVAEGLHIAEHFEAWCLRPHSE